MAMQCVEYKKHRTFKGELIDPPWGVDGGYFYDPDSKTYIGFVPQFNEREYYVDDTVRVIAKTEFVERGIRVNGLVEGGSWKDSDKFIEQFEQSLGEDVGEVTEGAELTYEQRIDYLNQFWAKRTGE